MTQRTRLVVSVSERDHSQGLATAAVTLVQYGDYECPYTRQSTHVVRAIQQQLGDRLRFVYRNFPLTEIHPHALHAAFAAEATAAQGKFWEMHDSIFHHQHTLEDSDLEQFAAAIGMDRQQFAHDMAQRPYLSRIEEDLQSGLRSGVRGTPTFLSTASSIQGPGSRKPCWLHSQKPARPSSITPPGVLTVMGLLGDLPRWTHKRTSCVLCSPMAA